MRKYINIIITVIITAILIMLPMQKTEAANFTISNSSVTLDVEKTTTININASTHTGRINITSSNSNVASVNTNSIWAENNSQSITISAKSEGTATITISGELFDTTINGEQKYTQTISVTVNKVKEEKPVTPEPEPEPEQPTEKPTVDPKPETEKPVVEEKPNFTDTNKTMYAAKDNMNLRASWSTSSKATTIKKGTELKVTATSDNKVNEYIWYRVTYNGQTLYVASNLLTTTKPEEEKKQEEKPVEEPKKDSEVTTEKTTSNETSKATKGLKGLEIEGLTLEPKFSANIYEYKVILKENLKELKINAELAVENSTITVAGNQELQEGENILTIIVYNAKKEVEATYQIIVNKSTLDLSSTDKMLQIGTKEATRNLIIFIASLAVAIIVLIIVLVIKHRNDYEYYEEDEYTDSEETVQNIPNITLQNEYQETKGEKKKGKHF